MIKLANQQFEILLKKWLIQERSSIYSKPQCKADEKVGSHMMPKYQPANNLLLTRKEMSLYNGGIRLSSTYWNIKSQRDSGCYTI